MKKVKICYKTDVKPSLTALLFCIILIIYTALCILVNNLFISIAILIPILYSFFRGFGRWIKRQKAYKAASKKYSAVIKYGNKYRGKIIKSESSMPNYNYHESKTICEHYAIIEYTDDNGKKVTFRTDDLTCSTEFLKNKECTVYSYNGIDYATDFASTNIPEN